MICSYNCPIPSITPPHFHIHLSYISSPTSSNLLLFSLTLLFLPSSFCSFYPIPLFCPIFPAFSASPSCHSLTSTFLPFDPAPFFHFPVCVVFLPLLLLLLLPLRHHRFPIVLSQPARLPGDGQSISIISRIISCSRSHPSSEDESQSNQRLSLSTHSIRHVRPFALFPYIHHPRHAHNTQYYNDIHIYV